MSIQEGPQFDRRETHFETGVPITPVIPNVATVLEDDRVVHTTVPVVDPPVVVERVMVQQVPAPAPIARVHTAFTRRFAPDAVIAAVIGVVLLIMGLLAITRAGLDGPMAIPVVHVLGFTHTATLGFIEIAAGLFLLIAGATSARDGALFMGTVLGIASFVGAIQTSSFRHSLALESSFAWLMVLASILIVVSALLMPRYVTRSTTVERLN